MLQEIEMVERISKSINIIEGEVISQRSFWDDKHYNIFTASKVKVLKSFKGQSNLRYIEVLTRGGIVGLEKQVDHPSLQLNKGDIGIFFLLGNDEKTQLNQLKSIPINKPAMGPQGFIKYHRKEGFASDVFKKYFNVQEDLYNLIQSKSGQNRIEVEDFSAEEWIKKESNNLMMSITSFTPTSLSAGTDTEITINGSGFGATQGSGFVSFSNADNGGATVDVNPVEDEYISWSDNQIIVQVPADAGTGVLSVTPDGGGTFTSASSLTVTHAELNATFENGGTFDSYPTQHVNRNGNGGYIWRQFTDFAASSAAPVFTTSLETWCNASGMYWQIGANTTVDVVANDNINIVRFDNGGELPGGVLGRATSRWSGCFTGGNPDLNWYVEELDIAFNDGTNWYYGASTSVPLSSYDFQSVAVHELGHAQQLGHVNASTVMSYAISNGTAVRNLSASEISGAQNVSGRSITTPVCSQSAMVNNLDCSNTILPVELVDFSAMKHGGVALLSWSTITELYNDHFVIERSVDGYNFESIGQVEGAGTTHDTKEYQFKDLNPHLGQNVYRLKQIDYDGNFEYSEFRILYFETDLKDVFVYPNPVYNSPLNITYRGSKDQSLEIELMNSDGRIVFQQIVSVSPGFQIQIPIMDQPSGIYWLRMKNGINTQIQKIINLE